MGLKMAPFVSLLYIYQVYLYIKPILNSSQLKINKIGYI